MIPSKALISRYEIPFFAVFTYIVGVLLHVDVNSIDL